MDFGNVRSLMIGGKAVSRLLVGGRLVWKKAEPGPAYDYDVEYVETDGALSYMDLGIVPDTHTSYEIDLMYEGGKFTGTQSLRNCAYGCATYTTTSSATYVLYFKQSDGFLKFGKPTSSLFTELVPGDRFKVSMSAVADGNASISVGDHVETVKNTYSAGTTMKFGCSYTGSPDFYATVRFYSAKFWQDGVLVRDLVPVVKDGESGLYDKVGNKFYGNASGAGSIAAGPRVVKIPYIETDGLSYVDLGFVPTSEFRFEACLRTVEGVDYKESDRFFGSSVGTSARLMRNSLAYGTSPYGWFFRTGGIIIVDFGHPDNEYHTFKVYDDGSYIALAYDDSDVFRDEVVYPSATTETMKIGMDVPSLGSSPIRVRYFKAWESGELIRDLVPYSGPRGVGLLDKVHDVLYTNAGGGTLTYGQEVGQKQAFVLTKGLADSFWAAPISQLGCSVAPANPEHFAFVVDMEFEDGFFTENYGIFGFTKLNLLFNQNMQSFPDDVSVYAYAPGSVINVNGVRHIVTPGERHVIKIEFDPLVGPSVDVDGEVSLGKSTSLKLPYDTSFKFGGNSTSTVVTSVSKPVKMRVYGVKILQFHNLVADLVPYNDGSDVGMMDKLSGNKFPGSNLEYGEV